MVQKYVSLVDLVKRFLTSNTLAKIGFDTGENEPLEVWGDSIHFFNSLHSGRSSSLPVDMRKATLCTSPTLREQLPIGLRPARGKFNSNSVLNIPNTMPGYTGYIEGKTSENVFGYRHSVLNTLCRDTRVGASASSWAGRKFDGISGYIPPPVPFGSVQTRFEHP